MKNILTILTFSFFLLILSCKKDKSDPIDTAELNLSFRAVYDGEPLVLNKEFNYLGKAVRFSKINFYISNLVVVNAEGERELSEVQFINLSDSHTTLADAMEGTKMSFSRVPVGTYSQLRLGIGVPADLNRTTPADYSTSHPLGVDNSGEYWEAWDSYIFAKIEGIYDVDGDGFDADDISFAYHPGTDRVYETTEFNRSVNLIAGETTTLKFELDIKELFTLPRGDLITLSEHDPSNQFQELIIIMDNFRDALQLR